MTGSTPSPLSQEVLRHANRVHAYFASAGDASSTERLAAEAGRWDATMTEVVVAGDINRGKSSLVSDLVDRPGLLPVDVDVTTAVHVAVGFGRPPSTRVTRVDLETGESRSDEIDAGDLARHVVVGGSDGSASAVTGAEVLIDHPLLERGLTLIDTPGVGGMTRGHRDITMASLLRADALVFVVSAVEPVTRSELEFLDEASERIANVILVASRADLGTAE
ncbi:MAG TPA: dynamin family protein, partial [Acidimicrobiales bacterium]|nr:dynamin family protein [Acidimicrobiales bacterium]